MVTTALLLAGQFFFFEAQPGLEVGEENAEGYALGFEAGAGGAWRGSLPRFFLIGRYGRSSISETVFRAQKSFESRRAYGDIAGGVRILVPIVEPFRIYGEVLGGATSATTEITRAELPPLTSRRFRPIIQAAAGVQFRLHENLSVGARFQYTWLDDEPDALAIAASQPVEPTRVTYSLSLGLHF
jgi:hypothetical protein